MSFNNLGVEIFSATLDFLNETIKNDEYYYNLLDTIIELNDDWGEEISFTEIRDKCIDKFDEDVDWTRKEWNQQTFRRLFIATKLNHLNDQKYDDEVLYSPTQSSVDFQLKRLYPLTVEKDWADGDERKEEFIEKTEEIEEEDEEEIDVEIANRNFLRKFISDSVLKKRGVTVPPVPVKAERESVIEESVVPGESSEPDYPSIAQSAQEIKFVNGNQLIIQNDLMEDEHIDMGLADYYDHITFNLNNMQIKELVLTDFKENKENNNKENNVFFQIYKSSVNIYDSTAVTVCSGQFNIEDKGKNILPFSLKSELEDGGINYSMLIYKKPDEVNGTLFYKLEGIGVDEYSSTSEDENMPSRADLLAKIDKLTGALESLSEKVEDNEKELKIPKQALENEESIDLLSNLLVEEGEKKSSVKQKIMAIDGSNVMRIRGTRATFSRLQVAVKYCIDNNYDKIYIICDANLRYKLNEADREMYEQMLKGESDKVHVQQSPGGTIADLFILNMANNFHKKGHEVKVMSNDMFRDFTKIDGGNYNPEIEYLINDKNLLLKFMFIEGPDGKEMFFENKPDKSKSRNNKFY